MKEKMSYGKKDSSMGYSGGCYSQPSMHGKMVKAQNAAQPKMTGVSGTKLSTKKTEGKK